jgi:hypothetical protein
MKGKTVFRCDGEERSVEISLRDVRLLGDTYFVAHYGSFRAVFGLDFVAGLGAPPLHTVGGLSGHISTHPNGYCWVELSDRAPTGRGRVVEMIDMRVRRRLETDDWGTLTVTRRASEVGWFRTLPPLIEWLRAQRAKEVEVLHA